MSERPSDSGITPGDPLNPGEEPPRHESGLPAPPREQPSGGGGLWASPEAPAAPDYYTSPPPPGAGGAPPAAHPAPLGGQLVLSGWWRRVGAQIIDGLIISAVAFAIIIPFGIGFIGADDDDSGFVALAAGLIVALLVWAVVALFYAPVMLARTNGKTLGRMATGIRVVRADGKAMTFGVAFIREIILKTLLIGIASSFLFSIPYLLDVLWPLWDEENRALHDFPVNTRVVLD